MAGKELTSAQRTWGDGYRKGRRDGYNKCSAEESLIGTAFAVGAAVVGAGIGFAAGKLLGGGSSGCTFLCRRCGEAFSVQKGARPCCPYCSDDDKDDEYDCDDDEDDEYDDDEYDEDDE